jgi:hypothetical protein
LTEDGKNEGALTRSPNDEARGLQFAVGLRHRVGVDGERCDHVPYLEQLVAGLQIAES